jgi:hypothetical protein
MMNVLCLITTPSPCDLYDFQYGTGFLATHAARLQAGYPSLGMAGRVYQVDRVNFEGSSGMLRDE